MQFINRELVRSGFVRALRTVFESNTDYQYRTSLTDPNQPDDNSGIFIYDSYPWKKIGYPAIIVTLGPGDPLMRTIGREFKFGNSTDFVNAQDGLTYSNIDSEVYGGGEQNVVHIEVFDRSAVGRARIIDWVDIYLRHFFVDTFQKQGVTVVEMSHSGERVELVGNDPVYIDAVAVTVYSEFVRTISTELAGTIDAMSLTGVFIINTDGSTNADDTNQNNNV